MGGGAILKTGGRANPNISPISPFLKPPLQLARDLLAIAKFLLEL